MRNRALLLGTLLGGMAIATPAKAQSIPWVDNPFLGQGIGIRAGDFVFHPSVGTEFGYDSNYWQSGGTVKQGDVVLSAEDPIPTLRWQLIPSLTLETINSGDRTARGGRDARKVTFSSNLNLVLNQVIPLKSENETGELPDKTTVSGGGGLALAFFPKGRFGFNLGGQYQRVAQPNNTPTSVLSLNRQSARADTGIVWRPGGKQFSWGAGYEFRMEFFEETGFGNLNYLQHFGTTSGSWAFLPRTALSFDGRVGVTRYSESESNLTNSTDVRVRIGINGRLTPKISALAIIGWTAGFFDDNPNATVQQANYSAPIGEVRLSYRLRKSSIGKRALPAGPSALTVGYQHGEAPSSLGNYYFNDRVYTSMGYYLGYLVLNAAVGVNFVHYQKSYFAANETGGAVVVRNNPFTAPLLDAGLFAEYRVIDQLGIGGTFQFSSNLSPLKVREGLIPTTPDLSSFDNIRFQRYQVMLSVRWFM